MMMLTLGVNTFLPLVLILTLSSPIIQAAVLLVSSLLFLGLALVALALWKQRPVRGVVSSRE